MKEYKTVEIKIDAKIKVKDALTLGDQLNEFAKDGWSLVQVITKNINHDNGRTEFIYILEREVLFYEENVHGLIGSKPIKIKRHYT